jgi:thymidine kinase
MRSPRSGFLSVITGPMFAGKTSALIAQARCREALALKPAFDTRAGGHLISRDGSAVRALAISSWPAEAADCPILVLDEAQFMTAPYYEGDIVDDALGAVRAGAAVTVSGLDTDYLRRPFAVMARFRAWADQEMVLRARCHVCGKPAPWTAKKSETGHLLEVGDAGLYEARCDAHWSAP